MEHSIIGPSGVEKWLNCPGSAWMESQMPPEEEKDYTIEGSIAHTVAENALLGENGNRPEYIEAVKHPLYSPEMEDYARAYREYVVGICPCGSKGIHGIETTFELDCIVKGMVGTTDFYCYNAATRTLHVIDYKYGMGVRVDAHKNKQLSIYAYGAFQLLMVNNPVENISLHIFQPRIGNTSEYLYLGCEGVNEFLMLMDRVMKAARLADSMLKGEVEAESFAGKHCKFCKAKGMCYTLAHEYKDIYIHMIKNKGDNRGEMKAELLSEENFIDVYNRLDEVQGFMNAVKEVAINNAVNKGKVVPGYKLVDGRSQRKWLDEGKASHYLSMCGLTDIYDTKLKSPSQVEKLVGKQAAGFIEPFVIKEKGKPKLVPEIEKGGYSGKTDYSKVF